MDSGVFAPVVSQESATSEESAGTTFSAGSAPSPMTGVESAHVTGAAASWARMASWISSQKLEGFAMRGLAPSDVGSRLSSPVRL